MDVLAAADPTLPGSPADGRRHTLPPGLLDALRAAVGPGGVAVDPDVTASYARDMMPLAPAGTPGAVVLPTDTGQVAAVVRACAEAGVPIVPRGAGSGLSGAANAVDGAVTLVMTRMDAILEVDEANRLAVVQPGVVNRDLRRAVESRGLFYAPDPSSYDWCTLGGNLSTNAGGLCCVKYGVTTDAVLGLQVVLASGEVLRTGRRTVKGVAGYDLTRLIVGSEGTLGVITEATLSLRPLPAAPCTLVAAFSSAEQAGAAVTGAVRAGLVPSLLEIMDATSITAVERHTGVRMLGDEDTPAALLLGQSDAGGALGMAEMEHLERVCLAAGAVFSFVTDDLAEGRMLLQARRDVLTALETLGSWLTDDVCVPRTAIAPLIAACARIAAEEGVVVAVVGHAGDGNMHPTLVYDAADPAHVAAAHRAFDRILTAGTELGGTVTGEHGIGRIKQDFLAREIGPVGLSVHRAIKAALDPQGLFNPGSMFSMR
ncbi:FAD-binding protein [Nakamurella flavida]|uniref:FAD-binding protein n=1 Tax=Nakamurella flavida TaxID=363630 RepID=A0A938YH28_9ACTN|nr:FAD-linked oxidase C-terminal domain-containing protein [Nakamurella flavida]MBM9477546.1 FAD-binding protein [Nakamurella flavida]MDP9779094.1 glycolate oxidase [Nakamurella flavida]